MNSRDSMAHRVDQYLAMRRAFGYQLSISGDILHDFARFADRTEPGMPLTSDMALCWAQTTRSRKRTSAARRLLILRPFARYLRSVDPLTVIPPKGILGAAQHRHVPHIYTDQELQDLLGATDGLRPRGGLRSRSIRTYLNLLACAGMRPSEPLKLTRNDVDFQTHTITIRETKFSKSRIIVVHPTTTEGLQCYARCRDQHVRQPQSSNFFLLDDGSALTHKKALWAFRYLRHRLGWESQPGRGLPRLYDLRHTFVCHRLLKWYREDVDVHVAISALSTYLGHVKITDTYWYVTALPELMNVVGYRFERFARRHEGDSQ